VSGLISKPKANMHLRKKNNPSVRQQPFYSIAEVYNYNISAGKSFDFGDKKIISKGFNSMINFEFKYDAQKTMNLYSQSTPILNGELKGNSFELFIFS
jgi:alpha-amylase